MSLLRAIAGILIAVAAFAATLVVGTISGIIAAIVTGTMMVCGVLLVLATILWLLLQSLWNALTKPRP